jgi:hypothetical protein
MIAEIRQEGVVQGTTGGPDHLSRHYYSGKGKINAIFSPKPLLFYVEPF